MKHSLFLSRRRRKGSERIYTHTESARQNGEKRETKKKKKEIQKKEQKRVKKRQKEHPKNVQRETSVFFPHSSERKREKRIEREREKNDYDDDAAIPERQFRHLFLLLFF